MSNKTRVNFLIQTDLYEEITVMAEKEGGSASDILRRAAKEYVDKQKKLTELKFTGVDHEPRTTESESRA